mmetsp:Transcript_102079/g.288280  ORF Transcript_102079/g.288280 Transcript_102079/m.288280 type:complete len:239 (-) Transcript_102079:173-889(-)
MDLKTNMTMHMLKQKVEGERRKVNRRPEVYITVQEFVLQDDGAIAFSPQEFSLSGLRVHAFVEIIGTQRQIAKELGQEAAARLLKRAGSWFGRKKKKTNETRDAREKATLVGKQSSPAASGGDAGEVQQEDDDDEHEVVQTCVVELTLRMSKQAQDEKVKVKISDLSVGENTFTSTKVAQKALGNPRIRTMIEAGISKVVMHAFTKKLRKARTKVWDAAYRKVCCCFSRCAKTSTISN